jgi:hypothetical protein
MLVVWFAAGAVCALAAAGAHYLRRDARLEGAAAKLPLTPMHQVVDGRRVKVAGIVNPESVRLTGPITGRACAAWSVDLQQWDSEQHCWDDLLTEWRSEDFVLVGDGVSARVVVDGAEVVYVTDRLARADWRKPPPERVREFLARHRRSVVGYFAGTYRCREAVLEPGERIVVVGVARRELDATPHTGGGAYREPPQRLVFAAAGAAPLWIFDGTGRRRAG